MLPNSACPSCKQPIPEDAQFCPFCGYSFAELIHEEQGFPVNQSSETGECPNCGAFYNFPIPAYCGSCGYALSQPDVIGKIPEPFFTPPPRPIFKDRTNNVASQIVKDAVKDSEEPHSNWNSYLIGTAVIGVFLLLGLFLVGGMALLQMNNRTEQTTAVSTLDVNAIYTSVVQTVQADSAQTAIYAITITPTFPSFTPLPVIDAQPSPIIPTITPVISQSEELSAGATIISPLDSTVMVYVPAGEFTMGSDTGNNDEKPVHTVYLDAFWIDQTEATNAMFTVFVAAKGYRTDAEKDGESKVWFGEGVNIVKGADWQHPTGTADSIAGLEKHPVVQVSWNDAKAYCEWAGRRLPTEAEWEKAARGNSASKFPWGSKFNCQFGNYDDEKNIDSFILEEGYAGCDGFPRTAPVGSFPEGKSPYGVYDMSGNVWEWVADWYSKTYYSESPSNNPVGPANGTNKVARGGSWFSEMMFLYIPYRDGEENYPSHRDDILGFRCATNNVP